MADAKISDLAADSSIGGAEQIPVNDAGTNKRISTSDMALFAGFRGAGRNAVLLFDGDSKGLEPYYALKSAVARQPVDVVFRPGDTLGVGGSTSGTGTNNLTNTTRMATASAKVAALLTEGFRNVDVVLTMGTNESSGTASSTLVTNIGVYWANMKAAGARRLFVCSVDPHGATNTTTNDFKQQRNRALRDMCRRSNEEMVWVDMTTYLLDADSNGWNPLGGGSQAYGSVMYDTAGLHCSGFGMYMKSFAWDDILAKYYPKVGFEIPASPNETYDGTTNKWANLIQGGRFKAIGGTDSITLVGAAAKSGTPPAGWTGTGPLQDGLTLTMSAAAASEASAILKRPAANPINGVRIQLTGTPAVSGTLAFTKVGPTVNVPSGATIRRQLLYYIRSLTGIANMQTVAGGGGTGDGIVIGNPSGAPGVFDNLAFVAPGLNFYHRDYTSSGYASENHSISFFYTAGVPVNWDIDLIDLAAYRTDP